MNKNKIISRFYVIYGDGTPLYVGYTNRTVKQRFKEHKDDKDFSSYDKVEVKEVDNLKFDFTWDMVRVNENAKQVSDRESELIAEYNTQDSLYQKGLGELQGGQTWASVKGFVHSNKDNPKYMVMDNQELLVYLDNYHNKVAKLNGFISNYQDPEGSKLSNFISRYRDPRLAKLSNFISFYHDPKILKLSSFISRYRDPRLAKLSSFISGYQDYRMFKIKGFISNYKDPKVSKLSHFISAYKDPKVIKLKSFITNYREPNVSKLANFISQYNKK